MVNDSRLIEGKFYCYKIKCASTVDALAKSLSVMFFPQILLELAKCSANSPDSP